MTTKYNTGLPTISYWATSVYSTNYAYLAGDADTGTMWRAGAVPPQSISVDFGLDQLYVIDEFKFYNTAYAGHPANVDIQGGNPNTSGGIDWTNIETSKDIPSYATWQSVTFTNTTPYRYYRIVVNSTRTAGWTPRIYEWELYGPDSQSPAAELTQFNNSSHTYTASSSYTSETEPQYAGDADDNTYWRPTAAAFPAWWKCDLGVARTVTRVSIHAYDLTRTCKNLVISGSNDDSNWTQLWSGLTELNNGVDIEFLFTNAVAYRYYKIDFTDSTSATFLNIYEVGLWGAGAATQELLPSAISSAEAFGTAKLDLTIAPSAIASAEAFGTTKINQTVLPSGIESAEALGTPQLVYTQNISPASVSNYTIPGSWYGGDAPWWSFYVVLNHPVYPDSTTLRVGSTDYPSNGVVNGVESFGTSPNIAYLNLKQGALIINSWGTSSPPSPVISYSYGAILSEEAFGTASLELLSVSNPGPGTPGTVLGGRNWRVIINSLQTANRIKLVLRGSSLKLGSPAVLTGCSIWVRDDSDDDFYPSPPIIGAPITPIPTRITFNGGDYGVELPSDTEVESDWIPFVPTVGSQYLIHFHFEGTHSFVYWPGPGTYLDSRLDPDDETTKMKVSYDLDYPSSMLFIKEIRLQIAQQLAVTAGIPSSEIFGTPSVGLSVSPTAIASEEAFGDAKLTLNVAPSSITSEEAHGSPLVYVYGTTQTILPIAIPSEEAVSSPALIYNQEVAPPSIDSLEAVPGPVLDLRIYPTGVAGDEAVGDPVITPTYQITPEAISSEQGFGLARVVRMQYVLPDGIGSAEAIGALSLLYAVAPLAISSEEGSGVPQIFPGPVTVAPIGIDSQERFGTQLIERGAVPEFETIPLWAHDLREIELVIGLDDVVLWAEELQEIVANG